MEIGFPQVTDEGFLHLLVALKDVNCKLTKLSLEGNELMDQFIPHLCSALEDPNCKLIKLDLTLNKFTEQGKNMLHQALKSENRTSHIKVEV